MKKKLFILFVLLTFISEAQKKPVKIHIQQYNPYCGGARPPKEMEEATKIPQPYANKTLIYKNSKGLVDSVKTNDSGIVVLNLKYSTYKFYETWRYYKSLPDVILKNNFDKTCMKAEWQKSLFTVSVSKTSDTKTQNIEIQNKCPHQQPCIIKVHLPE
jgi:hypothetical protein